jgi:hypothetical protein
MPQVSFPIFCLTDKTKFGNLAPLFAATAKRLAAERVPNTILIYEVSDAPEWAHGAVKPSEQPERMILMVYNPKTKQAIANALLNVKARLPQEPSKKKLHITAKDHTPLRNIFKQMAALPLTEFNITPDSAPDTGLFFLRSRELIAEFRSELPKIVIS